MSFAHLPTRAVLKLSGEDKDEFLQGLITNDIDLLQTQKAIYACLLTPQGKYLYDFFVVRDGDTYLIDCEAERCEGLLKKLKLHRLRSKVVMKETDARVYVSWGRSGVPEGGYQDPRLDVLGHRLISQVELACNDSEDNYIQHCHRQGVPYHSLDLIPQKSILLESNMDELNAISWDKGCYMGQELTARTKHRGLIRKRLIPVLIDGPTPSFGAPVLQGKKEVGEMRSAQENLGMARLRLEALGKKMETFISEGSQIKPYVPEWMDV